MLRLMALNIIIKVRGKRYRIRKTPIAVIILTISVFLVFKVIYSRPKGKTEDMVSIPVLTKDENRALLRYLNDDHLAIARSKGLDKPLQSNAEYQAEAKTFGNRYQLLEIADNKYYEIPHLTNSLPYLQTPAKEFLTLLGKNFCDQLEELGMTEYRFSVTSILRTIEDQKALRRNNVNATANNSSHYYGRTFDIAQTRFFERGNSNPVYSYRLRNILLRVLIKMQDEGKCYVLLESQTKCIHVTVR